MFFHWSLSDSKSPQVSRTLLSILADLNNVIVWMVSTRPLFSNSPNTFTNRFGIVQSVPITIGISVTFMFPIIFFFLVLYYFCYYNYSKVISTKLQPKRFSVFIMNMWFLAYIILDFGICDFCRFSG